MALPRSLTPGAAIRQIEVARAKRIYRETPALQLLGMEDEYQARAEWCDRLGRPMDPGERQLLREIKEELARRASADIVLAQIEFRRRNKIWSYFPDEGPLRRELYPRHMEFIGDTLTDDEVLFMAGNKVGKSLLGAYCVACWTTGRYPPWWHGRRFDYPTTFWIANKSAKDVRDINEQELLGPPGDSAAQGTGMIPGHLIAKTVPKPGVPNAYEFIHVKHVSGGTSYIQSKSYDQGRTAFQGRNIDGVWNDEEIDRETYDEELMRVMVTRGLVVTTYTPILGLTELTVWYMEQAGFSIEDIRHGLDPVAEEA